MISCMKALGSNTPAGTPATPMRRYGWCPALVETFPSNPACSCSSVSLRVMPQLSALGIYCIALWSKPRLWGLASMRPSNTNSFFSTKPPTLFDKSTIEIYSPSHQDFFGYSILRNSVHAELYQELLALGEAMDFPIEGLHTETGPGVIEAALGVDGAASAADKAALFKTFTKVWAQRKGLMATFMAKWSNDYPGQSGHIHLSLRHRDNDRSAFYDASQPLTMSTTQRHFIGGQQRYMPELLALVASTVNAYTRLVPGFWAPTDATWGCQKSHHRTADSFPAATARSG